MGIVGEGTVVRRVLVLSLRKGYLKVLFGDIERVELVVGRVLGMVVVVVV